MRVVRVQPYDDLSMAFNAGLAAEQLGLGFVIVRSDRCPMVEKEQQTGEPATEEEAEHHCPVHDHLAEYVVMVIEEPIPNAISATVVDSIEMFLATAEGVGHEDVFVPDDEDQDPTSGD